MQTVEQGVSKWGTVSHPRVDVMIETHRIQDKDNGCSHKQQGALSQLVNMSVFANLHTQLLSYTSNHTKRINNMAGKTWERTLPCFPSHDTYVSSSVNWFMTWSLFVHIHQIKFEPWSHRLPWSLPPSCSCETTIQNSASLPLFKQWPSVISRKCFKLV